MSVRDYAKRVRGAQSVKALFIILQHACMDIGAPYIGYFALKDHRRFGQFEHPPPLIMSSFPSSWTDVYFGRNLVSHDPLLNHAADIAVPFLWRWLHTLKPLTPDEEGILTVAARAGLNGGMTVPLLAPHGAWAIVNFASPHEWEIEPHMGRLGLYAAIFHLRFVELAGAGRAFPADVKLTPRELACLRWMAEGKTTPETALILGISVHTARAYTKSLLAKLGVNTRAMAVARAFRLDLLGDD